MPGRSHLSSIFEVGPLDLLRSFDLPQLRCE